MEDLVAVRAALDIAIDEVHAAIGTLRAAQGVDWVSVFASRYREELYIAIQSLASFRDRLESAWASAV